MDNEHAYVKLWHASGVQVTIPVSAETALTVDAAALLYANVSMLLGAGWLVNPPHLEEGEFEQPVYFIVRREHSGEKGITPVIDIYGERGDYRNGFVYLNTDQDIADFEAACGVGLNKLALYNSEVPLIRKKNPAKDQQYLYALSTPAIAIFKPNPYYEPESKKPKNVFVRWKGKQASVPTPASTQQPVPPLTVVDKPVNEKPDKVPTLTAQDWRPILDYYNAQGMNNAEILDALGVSVLRDWRGTLSDAEQQIQNALTEHRSNPVFSLIVHKATKKTVQTTKQKRGGVCVSFGGVMRYSPETVRKIDVWDWDGNLDALREAGLNMDWLTQPGTQVFNPPLTVNATLGDDGYFKIVSCDDASGVTVKQDTFDDLLPA